MRASLRTGSGLRGGKIPGTSLDPMSNVANLSDVMLVLALAFMVALIAYWGIMLPGVEQIEFDQNDTGTVVDVDEESGDYELAGTVYRDAKSGKMYMVEGQ